MTKIIADRPADATSDGPGPEFGQGGRHHDRRPERSVPRVVLPRQDQRRTARLPAAAARAWAFWGWIVPIVNLWFPFQIMGDIWRAGLPAERRGETAWLPALWWTCWLLSGLGIFGAGKMPVNSGSVPHIVTDTNTGSLCFLAVAGALLIAIIRAVSDGPVGSPQARSWAPLVPPVTWPAAVS